MTIVLVVCVALRQAYWPESLISPPGHAALADDIRRRQISTHTNNYYYYYYY